MSQESQGESWLVRDQIAQLRRDVEGARQIIEGQEEAIKMLREEIAMLRNGVLDSQELAPGPEPLGAPPSSIQQVPPERREESPAAPSRDVEPESPSLSPPQGPQHTRRTIFWAAGQHGPPRPSERQSNRSSSQIWTPETESRPTPTWRDTSFG